ncbi:MAG: hypothetical protein RLZZ495_551 [Pseudomonadota bacterium]
MVSPMVSIRLIVIACMAILPVAPVVHAENAIKKDAPPLIAWSASQIQLAGVQTHIVGAGSNGAVRDAVTFQGTVILPPQATMVVSAPLAGVVQDIGVGVGQSVRAGQTVARLMSSQLLEWQRDTRQAQSNAKLAQAKLQRDEQLAAEGLIAQVRLQETRNQYEIAQSIAAERRQAMQLAGGVAESNQPLLALNAAVAGTVMEVLATPGQRVEMGMPVLRIARAGLLAVELQATLAQARTLRVGDSITLEGCRTPARLAAIAPSVNANNQSVVLRADFQSTEPCLRINQFVQASVKSLANTANTVNTVNTVHVPASATVQRDGKAYAFVRKPQGFAPVAVEDVRSGDAIAVQGIAALKGAWMGLGAAEASGVAGGQ